MEGGSTVAMITGNAATGGAIACVAFAAAGSDGNADTAESFSCSLVQILVKKAR